MAGQELFKLSLRVLSPEYFGDSIVHLVSLVDLVH